MTGEAKMLPTYAPHKPRNRRTGVYLVLVVILSLGLVGQFAYWRRQVTNLVVEGDLLRAQLGQQEAVKQQLLMETSKQNGEVQKALQEKEEMDRLIKYLENTVKSDEDEKTEMNKELEGTKDELNKLKAIYGKLQQECKAQAAQLQEVQITIESLKQELQAMNSDSSLEETAKREDQSTIISESNKLGGTDGDSLQGKVGSDSSKDADSIAIQTGGVGEEWGDGNPVTKDQMLGRGAASGVLEQLQHTQGQINENRVVEGSADGKQLVAESSVGELMGTPDLKNAVGLARVNSQDDGAITFA